MKDFRGDQKLCAGKGFTDFDISVEDIVKKLDSYFGSEGKLLSAYYGDDVKVRFYERNGEVQIGLSLSNPFFDLDGILPKKILQDIYFDHTYTTAFIRLKITNGFYDSKKSSQSKYKSLQDKFGKNAVHSFRTYTNLSEKAIKEILPVLKLLSRFKNLQKMCSSYGVDVNLDPMYGFSLYSKGTLKIEIGRLSEQLMLLGNGLLSLDYLKLASSAYKAPAPIAEGYLDQLYDAPGMLAIDISEQEDYSHGAPANAPAHSPSVGSFFECNTASLNERFLRLQEIRRSLALDTHCTGLESKFSDLDAVVQQKIQSYDGSSALGYYSQRMRRVTFHNYEQLVYVLKMNKESFSGSVYEKLLMKMADFSGCAEGLATKVQSLIPSPDQFGLVDLRKEILKEEITKDGYTGESSEAMASVSYHLRMVLSLGKIPKPDNFWVSDINSLKYIEKFKEHYTVDKILKTAVACFSSRLDDMIRADENGDLVMNVDGFLLDLGVREEEKSSFLNESGDIDYQFLKLCLPYHVLRRLMCDEFFQFT
tara:strand:- start:503 stop:2107 length:1605 start_codon:yes stop_codon:yes gene_type:complete